MYNISQYRELIKEYFNSEDKTIHHYVVLEYCLDIAEGKCFSEDMRATLENNLKPALKIGGDVLLTYGFWEAMAREIWDLWKADYFTINISSRRKLKHKIESVMAYLISGNI
jgi:hypothetical protein